MLDIKTRQTYLNEIGIKVGAVDGIEGKKTRAGYLALQKMYFTRQSDIDGLYGKNTEILLINAYRIAIYTHNFNVKEFRCGCGGKYCTGYPDTLNPQLLRNLQSSRNQFGATTITSGLRCKRYNNSLRGSSRTSKHLSGMALDIYNASTRTEAGRVTVMGYFRNLPKHSYTYANIRGSHPNMGNAVHFDVKL